MRLISEKDVQALIVPSDAINLAAHAFIRQSSGDQPAPGRLDLRRPSPKAGMLVLAGFSSDGLGIVKSNMHAYRGEPAERHTASLLALWDMAACRPLALISSAAFNGHRTASGFAAAARLLAPANAGTVTIFGAGHMAAPAIAYMAAVRPISRAIVVSRRGEQAEAFVDRLREAGRFPGITLEATADREQATRAADIIVCVTSADSPVFPGHAVRDGAFVVLGGANRPAAREADDAFIARARIYVDHMAGCLEKAGDLKVPIAGGVLRQGDVAGEIGEFLAAPSRVGSAPTRPLAFKSIGVAPQDIALAEHVLEKARAGGVGVEFDFRTGRIGGPAA